MNNSMLINDLKAEFSLAYVRAVAHAAGYFIQESNRTFDSDGIDLTLLCRSAHGIVRSPRLDIQVKATSDDLMKRKFFPYDLDIKNYNELRDTHLQVPRILVVVLVPKDIKLWVHTSDKGLLLRKCGYWKSLRGESQTDNKTSIRINMDCSACFHVKQVASIMDRIQAGGEA